MPCAISSQMEVKKPGSDGFPAGSSADDFENNMNTNMKYIDLVVKDSELDCKRCVPTGYKCTLQKDNNIIPGQPGQPGQIVDSYFYTDDKTLETGLLPRMIDSIGRTMTGISIDKALSVSEEYSICRPYPVNINKDEDGSIIEAWCIIDDASIRDANFDINSFDDDYAKELARKVRSNRATGQQSGFQNMNMNMNMNKLNPQNLTLDDEIPMKIYYALLGVGGIYLLYQLSKKYGIKLNLD